MREPEYRRVTQGTANLEIPEPGKRIEYFGHVVKVERVIARVKALRLRGAVRYGGIQIVLPKECIGRPAYVIVYVLMDSDKLKEPVKEPEPKREYEPKTPMYRVVY